MFEHDDDRDFEYQTEAQMHIGAIRAGWSSTEDPETCACHGSGWILSQLDTFEECRIHYTGQTHPENVCCDCEQRRCDCEPSPVPAPDTSRDEIIEGDPDGIWF
jgi:hypothetical protein